MKKIFVCQPMTGLDPKDVISERERAIKIFAKFLKCPETEIEVVDPFRETGAPDDSPAKGLWYVGNTLIDMQYAECVLLLDGWTTHKGCNIEVFAAIKHNIPIYLINKHGMVYSITPTLDIYDGWELNILFAWNLLSLGEEND